MTCSLEKKGYKSPPPPTKYDYCIVILVENYGPRNFHLNFQANIPPPHQRDPGHVVGEARKFLGQVWKFCCEDTLIIPA
jgi:hypothetical protein